MGRVGGSGYQALRAVARARWAAEDAPCWICGQPIAWDEPDGTTDDSFELDHFYPVQVRPDLEMDPGNFRPSNRSCNRSRGTGAPLPPIDNMSRDWSRPKPEETPDAEAPAR